MTPTFPLDAKYVEIHGCEHERKSFTMAANKHWGFVITLRGENSVHLKFTVPGTYLTSKLLLVIIMVTKKKPLQYTLFLWMQP